VVQHIAHTAVFHLHALGHTRGAGGVDHVGKVARIDAALVAKGGGNLGGSGLPCGEKTALEVLNEKHLAIEDVWCEQVLQLAAGDDEARAGVLEVPLHALLGQRLIEGQVGCTGEQHTARRFDVLDVAWEQDADEVVGEFLARELGGDGRSDRAGVLDELGIGNFAVGFVRLARTPDGRPIGVGVGACQDHVGERAGWEVA